MHKRLATSPFDTDMQFWQRQSNSSTGEAERDVDKERKANFHLKTDLFQGLKHFVAESEMIISRATDANLGNIFGTLAHGRAVLSLDFYAL